MPTNHRRIAIVRDEEVERALEAARGTSAGARRPDASLARELVLRGARAIAEEVERDEFSRWVIAAGGTPAVGSIGDVLDELGPLPPYDPEDPYPAQRILEEMRRDKI